MPLLQKEKVMNKPTKQGKTIMAPAVKMHGIANALAPVKPLTKVAKPKLAKPEKIRKRKKDLDTMPIQDFMNLRNGQ